jgi:molybdate transport system ATP-binding protein
MVLADRLVVIEAGTVVQYGTPTEVAHRPRTTYIARLVGLNLYSGTGCGTTVCLDGGARLTVANAVEGPAYVAFPPAAVALHTIHPNGSPRNVCQVVVTGLELHGDQISHRTNPYHR